MPRELKGETETRVREVERNKQESNDIETREEAREKQDRDGGSVRKGESRTISRRQTSGNFF